ncbi:MAG: hypothetical protein WC026_16200 [Hyphomicrobium sp.]|uniref:hypothetical protein n=1 Tax=Hyphomicrobium sp. TaxID=82 RepID=UPI003568C2AE
MTDPKEPDEIEKLKLENAKLLNENRKLKEEKKALIPTAALTDSRGIPLARIF